MALKIAISGKGGTGKTTVAAILASLYARDGCRVLAVDADPASSLPAALGVPEEVRKRIVPLSQMLDIIEERTGARPGESYGNLFSLNPRWIPGEVCNSGRRLYRCPRARTIKPDWLLCPELVAQRPAQHLVRKTGLLSSI